MAVASFPGKSRYWKFILVGTIIFIGCFLYGLTRIHTFLAQTNRVESEVLVVEGWLPNYALEDAAREFKAHGYKKLLTIGGPLPSEFRLFTTGSLVFTLPDSLVPPKKPDSLYVTAFGSQIKGTFAHFTFSVNDTIIGDTYTTDETVRYGFATDAIRGPVREIRVYFDNDAYRDGMDCDLYVRSVEIAGGEIEPTAGFVVYDLGKPDGIQVESTAYRSYAAGAATVLTGLGLPEKQVISIDAPPVRRHKTYTSLSELKTWLEANHYHSINVLTLGTHARRSWLTAQRALGKDIKVGIISVENQRYDPQQWWFSKKGRGIVSTEFAKYFYMKFLYNWLE